MYVLYIKDLHNISSHQIQDMTTVDDLDDLDDLHGLDDPDRHLSEVWMFRTGILVPVAWSFPVIPCLRPRREKGLWYTVIWLE